MNILVIGSGGREHAICSAFARSKYQPKIYCANGNAGIAAIAECVPVRPDDVKALADLAAAKAVDLTFVGGETALALGIADEFESRGLQIIGPCREAAQLEASKAFAKDFMGRHGIPTARYATAHSPDFAIEMLESGDFGDASRSVVVKADGLAAGKGVTVAGDRAEAAAAINDLAASGGPAAAKIIIEECLAGTEVSLLAFVDGEDFALMPAARDHKRIGNGDTGPNTGGMGTFTDASLLTAEQIGDIAERILKPTLHGCIREGMRYRGVLFLGLMMTAAGPMLLEYNVRFGDPETQSILVRLETDLVDICGAMLNGSLSSTEIEWRKGSSACVVLAAEGYPGKPRTGDVITGLPDAATMPNVTLFHAATSRNAAGEYCSAGGRVLGVTAVGDTLSNAVSTAYGAAGKIAWQGMQYRSDIGK